MQAKTRKIITASVSILLALLMIGSAIAAGITAALQEKATAEGPLSAWGVTLPDTLEEKYVGQSDSSADTRAIIRHYKSQTSIDTGFFAVSSFQSQVGKREVDFVSAQQKLVEATGQKVDLKLDLMSKVKWVQPEDAPEKQMLVILAPNGLDYYTFESFQ